MEALTSSSCFWSDPNQDRFFVVVLKMLVTYCLLAFAAFVVFSFLHGQPVFAATITLPGDDASDKLEAAGTLLKLLDTGLFKWGAKLFAGLCIMSAAWHLKEQRFGLAVISVLGALTFGTATRWVKNIFDIGDNGGVFSLNQSARPIAFRLKVREFAFV